jgi:hypothetical protein
MGNAQFAIFNTAMKNICRQDKLLHKFQNTEITVTLHTQYSILSSINKHIESKHKRVKSFDKGCLRRKMRDYANGTNTEH